MRRLHRRSPRSLPRRPPVALPPVADDRAQPGDEAAHQLRQSRPLPATAATPRAEPPKPTVPTQPVPTQAAPTQIRSDAGTHSCAAAARGSFVVQLGTFGSRENADRLVRDMTAKGFAAFVAPYHKDGRELYRVRVGPTRDRAAAEALAAQLRRIGQSGSIVPIS